MGRKREHFRVNCASPCILHHEGINYRAILENISLGGASVKVGGRQPDKIYVGVAVDLMLCSNPDLCPIKYACNVTWLGASDIGVNFQNLKILSFDQQNAF
jgi:hypothetical protein